MLATKLAPTALFLVIILMCSLIGLVATFCRQASVCVGKNGDECHALAFNRTVDQLSDINEEDKSCTRLRIYLTSGIHPLSGDFICNTSDNQKISIRGISSSGASTIIICNNSAGMEFSGKESKLYFSNIIIRNCSATRKVSWDHNTWGVGPVALSLKNSLSCNLENVTISDAEGIGLYAYKCQSLTIKNCNFRGNKMGNVKIIFGWYRTIAKTAVTISRTMFANGISPIGGGLQISINSRVECTMVIKDSYFHRNSAVIGSHLAILVKNTKPEYPPFLSAHLLNCTFSEAMGTKPSVIVNSSKISCMVELIVEKSNFIQNHNGSIQIFKVCRTVLQDCLFERNHGILGNCSTIYLQNSQNISIDNVTVQDNNCTGITLDNSDLSVKKKLTIIRNLATEGGGVYLKNKAGLRRDQNTISLYKGAHLQIVNNSAGYYGGGIFSDKTCLKVRNISSFCPFQFEETKKQIEFSGNRAAIGGDIAAGGCFSHCYVKVKNRIYLANFTNYTNVFWKLVSSKHEQSSSTFAEYPNKIVFCENETLLWRSHTSCKSQYQVSAYPGKAFKVPLMVVDDFCIPSVGIFQAKVDIESRQQVYLGRSHELATFKQSAKFCTEYSFFVIGGAPGKTVTIHLSFQSPAAVPPIQLEVNLTECPVGFEYALGTGQCDCTKLLQSVGVGCTSTNHSLKVPPLTWIGYIVDEVAVSQYCQHCKNDGKQTLYPLNAVNSEILCKDKRTGILCSSCIANYSLQLGDYQCGNCIDSRYKGILLVTLFMGIGLILISALLCLNLTVSSGMINALIFISNVIYSNSENFLPVSSEGTTMLQRTVRFLSVFQAWMNLDFGITTCFFDGYDMYISIWMRFLFPLYIWLLVLLIVLTSRHSSKVSKLTSSKTVPLLATLLLLSYTKLLMTSIDAVSLTNLHFLEGAPNRAVWILDGNIRYLKGKHIAIFLVSFLWVFCFILPFTLLLLLGPALQSKSRLRYFNWINKLKPFLDAFYGPYTRAYRIWPGVLLLTRLFLFSSIAFYSFGDIVFKLLAISVTLTILLIIWITLARIHSVLPYQSRGLNYLEMFLYINLASFVAVSIYFQHTSADIVRQQVLAVVMVGAIFATFCSIVFYRVFQVFPIITALRKLLPSRNDDAKNDNESCNTKIPTQSTLEVNKMVANELREPLLTN